MVVVAQLENERKVFEKNVSFVKRGTGWDFE